MAKLNASERNALPSSDFALPRDRKFPVNDKAHAKNALARAAHKGGEVEKKVKAKVHRKYPGMGMKATTLGAMMGVS